jgi:hypothetical protein
MTTRTGGQRGNAGPERWPSVVLFALGAALAVGAILGPLLVGAIEWRISTNSLNQTFGADGAALLLLAPTAVTAGWLAWRARPLAAPLAFGLGLAALYYGIASVLGADHARYAGNNERFFLLYLAIIVLAWIAAAWGWSAMGDTAPHPGRPLARSAGLLFVAGGLAISAAWIVQLAAITVDGALTQPADALAYAESPTAFWLVRIVDLGFIVPLAIWSGIGLWRGWSSAAKAATGVAAFLTLQAAAVLAMGVVMLLRGDPTATPVLVAILAPITIGIAVVTVRLLTSFADQAAAPGRSAVA